MASANQRQFDRRTASLQEALARSSPGLQVRPGEPGRKLGGNPIETSKHGAARTAVIVASSGALRPRDGARLHEIFAGKVNVTMQLDSFVAAAPQAAC